MAYQIVPENSNSPCRVQGAQSAPMQLCLLEIPSLQSGQAPAATVALGCLALPRQLLASNALR